METPEKLAFHVSCDSTGGGQTKELLTMTCYLTDSTIELRNQSGALVLKRVPIKKGVVESTYIGAQLSLLSRHIRILDAANEQTAAYLRVTMEPAICFCKAADLKSYSKTLQIFLNSGLILSSCRLLDLRGTTLEDFIKALAPQVSMNGDLSVMPVSFIAFFVVRGRDASKQVARLAAAHPHFVHTGECFAESAVEDLVQKLNEQLGEVPKIPTNTEVTCCVIKPHALHHTGTIIGAMLENGFAIGAMQSFRLTNPSASEFLEVYRTTLKEFLQVVEEMTNGTVVVLQLEGPDAVARLRRLAGPYDPEVGRCLHPETLRARLGRDVARNAVHCTDLVDDGPLECNYFFQLMAAKPPSSNEPPSAAK